jgi:anti-sigma B factor antagonist
MSLSLSCTNLLNCVEISLKGKAFTEEDFSELKNQVDILLEAEQANLIINLKEIKILNSLGINMLIKIFTKCRNNGGDLYIVNISDKINHVLLLTKLNTVLNIANSTEEAVNYFN